MTCAKCNKPIRKGEHVDVRTFAKYVGIRDGSPVFEAWMTVVAHLREDETHTRGLDPEMVREARKSRRVLVARREETT